MGKEIPLEIRFAAEEMYIVDGLTYEDVSAATNVSVTQLQRWGSDGDWAKQKREYRQAFADIRRNSVLLRQKMIKQAMSTLDPQHVYAVARLESAASKVKNVVPADPDGTPPPAGNGIESVRINSPADAVDALTEIVERKLNAMLSMPGKADLKSIKNVKAVIDLVEKMKAKHGTDAPTASKSLDAETLRQIAEKIKLL